MSERASAVLFASEGDQYLGRPYSEMDCQEFVERMMRGVGITKNLRGSNAWYREMDWVGTPEECKQVFRKIPVGAILYIWEATGAPERYTDGRGNASHMGVYIGRKGGAIHSSYTRGCVAYSTFSGKSIRGGWNRVGLWRAMDYGESINRKLDNLSVSAGALTAPLIGEPSISDGPAGGLTMTEKQYEVFAEAGTTVNLRDKASLAGSLVTRVPIGATVTASPVNDGEWSAVSWGSFNGFMMSRFLRPHPSAAQAADTFPKGEGLTPATPTDLGTTSPVMKGQMVMVDWQWMKDVEDSIQELGERVRKLEGK